MNKILSYIKSDMGNCCLCNKPCTNTSKIDDFFYYICCDCEEQIYENYKLKNPFIKNIDISCLSNKEKSKFLDLYLKICKNKGFNF